LKYFEEMNMKGVEFVVDENGKKKAVVIDLKTHRALWEDFCDVLKAKEREGEPRESLDSVKQRVLKRG
jgi:hypothetical protein